MKHEISSYKNFGRVLFCTKGSLTLGFTLDIGPRIIYAALEDGDNIFYNDVERLTSQVGEQMENKFGVGKCWQLFGGHRVWLSPEKFPDTYRPDSDEVEYSIEGDVVTVIGQQYCGIQTKLEVKLLDNATAEVSNVIINNTPDDIYGSVWALSVMDKDGVAFTPQNMSDAGLLNNRTLSLWSYTDIHDGRLDLQNDGITVTQSSQYTSPFKIGVNNTLGVCAYRNRGKLFIKRFAPSELTLPYPDGGVNCEIYTCKHFTELETLSPLQNIKSGSQALHKEHWTLKHTEGDDDMLSLAK